MQISISWIIQFLKYSEGESRWKSDEVASLLGLSAYNLASKAYKTTGIFLQIKKPMNFFMSCYRRKCRDSNPDTAFAMDVLAGHWDTITPHLPGAVHRIRTCRSFPTNCFQDSSLTSPDIRHILVNNLRQLSLFFGWQGGTWTPRDRKASWFTVSAATNYGIPANIGRCDGSRTHTNIHSTTSEVVLYTSSSTHRKL